VLAASVVRRYILNRLQSVNYTITFSFLLLAERRIHFERRTWRASPALVCCG